jgi:hypothetical protein
MTVNLQPGSNSVTFYRHEPWIYNLQASASNREIVVTVTVNGTVTSPTQGEIELWVTNNPSLASPYSPSEVFNVTINPGLNTFSFTYPVSQAGTYYVYAAVLTYISTYTVTDQRNWTAVTLSQNYQVILNLLNGHQYFAVPHVYQGDNAGTPTNQWPVYYGPNNASEYWSQGGISNDQPVLELVPAQGGVAGAMFWSETYSGGSVTITMVGTFSKGISPPADGFEIYLFLNPTMWGISPKYNYSIPYTSTVGNGWAYSGYGYPSPHEGDIILPQSSTPYIMVQWDPFWQFGSTTTGATGQWNVWIVSNTNGNNPSVSPRDGIGTGAFEPHPGDLINITVIYNQSTNTLTGVAKDLNTTQSASFTLNLGSYYKPPSSGNYVFGIAGNTGGSYADWALLYVAMMGNISPPTYHSVNFIEVGLPPGATWNVTLNGVTNASTSPSITFTVPNGVYNYSVASPILVNGVEYVATKPNGTVIVNGTNVTVIVQYVPLPSPWVNGSTFGIITNNTSLGLRVLNNQLQWIDLYLLH